MKVTLLQTDISWAHPDHNISRAERMLSGVSDSDLYILPEMWSTGFATEPQGIAAPEESNAALQWMQQTARDRHCAVCGSLAVQCADGTFRNRFYFADGVSGSLTWYDKHHLFTHGHEDRFYTPGQQQVVVSYGGFRLLLLTCYDLRFPVWSRYAEGHEYDAIVVVANWPDTRQAAWQVLTRARAVENQCYLVGCNRVGDDQYSHYRGCSCVIDCYGKCLGQCHADCEQTLTASLDLQELQRRRGKFRVLNDRDDFGLIL